MCTVYSNDFVYHTVLPLIRFGVVYCSLANALPHFRFNFVGIRITHLNTWPFDRTRDGLTSKHSTHVRRALAIKTEPLQ